MKYLVVLILLQLLIIYNNDLQAQWVQTTGPYGGEILCLAVSGINIIAGTRNGVFLTTNNGTNWTKVNNGLTNNIIHALIVSGANIFAGTGEGVFLSTNNGTNWTKGNNGLNN